MRDGRRGMYCFAPRTGWYDQQLTKNVGLVPYIFYKEYGFHSVMVTGRGGSFPSLDTYVKGLELVKIELTEGEPLLHYDVKGLGMVKMGSPGQDPMIRYIEEHAEDMDVFVMHGANPFYYALLKRYREVRPDGKVYLELDPNGEWMDRVPVDLPIVQWYLSSCDVVGASCRRMQRYLSAKWPCRIEYLPNGFFDFTNEDSEVDFGRKEDIILTVGRIGTAQKRNETLLEAFAIAAPVINGWRLRLVGGVASEFQKYMEEYFQRHPDLRERVDFPGAIQDKRELMQEYRRAKVFALSSMQEGGTPNVVAEALHGGCYMVTSDIDGSSDVVDNGACGDVFPIHDAAALAAILQRVCPDRELLLKGGKRAVEYCRENFDFFKIAARLYYLLFDEPPKNAGHCMGA